MSEFIKEFYFGNIESQAQRSFRSHASCEAFFSTGLLTLIDSHFRYSILKTK